MRASLATKLVVVFTFGSLAPAQSQSAEPPPKAPANSNAARQHYQQATHLYMQYQQMCAPALDKECGASKLAEAIKEYWEGVPTKLTDNRKFHHVDDRLAL